MTSDHWTYEEETDDTQGNQGVLDDPWMTVTVPTPSLPSPPSSGASSATGKLVQTKRPSVLARFSRRAPTSRIAVFALVVLVVTGAFVGGITAFAASLRPPTPAPSSPRATLHRSSRPISTPQTLLHPTVSPPTPAATGPRATTQQDTFHRPDLTAGWGTTSAGASWRVTDSQRQPAFSVTNESGFIQAFLPGPSFYTATLGPSTASPTVEESATFVMSGFTPEQQTNVGILLRWQDNLTYYKAYLDGANLIILKNVLGQQSRLTQSPFLARNGISYTIRFRVEGHTLLAKAWESQQGEPNTWMVTTTDEQLTSGNVGIRALLASGNVVQVFSFMSIQMS